MSVLLRGIQFIQCLKPQVATGTDFLLQDQTARNPPALTAYAEAALQNLQ